MLYQRTSAQRHNPEKSDRYIEENTSSLVKEEDTGKTIKNVLGSSWQLRKIVDDADGIWYYSVRRKQN